MNATIEELLAALKRVDAQNIIVGRNGQAMVISRWGALSFGSGEELTAWVKEGGQDGK